MRKIALMAAAMVAAGCFTSPVNAQGCAGGSAYQKSSFRVRVKEVVHEQPVRSVVVGLSGRLVGIVENRPHLLAQTAHALACGAQQMREKVQYREKVVQRSTGCVGSASQVTVQTAFTSKSTSAAPVAVKMPPSVPVPQALSVFRDHKLLKRFLVRQGVPQEQLDRAEAKFGGPILGQILTILIEQGLPVLIEWLKTKLAGT